MTLTVALYDDFSRRMVWRVPDHVAYVNECPLHPPVRIRGWTKPAARLAPPPLLPPPPACCRVSSRGAYRGRGKRYSGGRGRHGRPPPSEISTPSPLYGVRAIARPQGGEGRSSRMILREAGG